MLTIVIGYWAYGTSAYAQGMPEPMFQPSKAKTLTQQERWQLDFTIANETTMREHGSAMFRSPGVFEKRANWFEEHAQWYELADLMRQLFDFRQVRIMNNEKAFNRLFELGKQGDIGASCTAALLYLHHDEYTRRNWKYSYETVVREALKHKDSGHPVCAGMEDGLYLRGELGYPKDKKLAHKYALIGAQQGFYKTQLIISGWHRLKDVALHPKHFALNMCWGKLAEQQVDTYAPPCELYREGKMNYGATIEKPLNLIDMPQDLKKIALDWCDAKTPPTIETCMALENQLAQEK